MRLLRCLLTAFLALRLLGGDLAVLQLVAWTSMILTRAPEQGMTAALESTFDGEHPCALCSAIAQAHDRDQKPLPEQGRGKLKTPEFITHETGVLPAPLEVAHASSQGPGGTDEWGMARMAEPVVPPPRC